MNKIDLKLLLQKMPDIPDVVIKCIGIESGCPWKPFLLGIYESVIFEFNGFVFQVYGGNWGHPNYHKPMKEYTACLWLSHKVYDYKIDQSINMVEANEILAKILDHTFLQCSNEKELEDFLIKLIN